MTEQQNLILSLDLNSENTVEETNFHIDASFVKEKPEVVNFILEWNLEMLILVQIRMVKQRGDQMLIKSNQNRRGVQPVISTQ